MQREQGEDSSSTQAHRWMVSNVGGEKSPVDPTHCFTPAFSQSSWCHEEEQRAVRRHNRLAASREPTAEPTGRHGGAQQVGEQLVRLVHRHNRLHAFRVHELPTRRGVSALTSPLLSAEDTRTCAMWFFSRSGSAPRIRRDSTLLHQGRRCSWCSSRLYSSDTWNTCAHPPLDRQHAACLISVPHRVIIKRVCTRLRLLSSCLFVAIRVGLSLSLRHVRAEAQITQCRAFFRAQCDPQQHWAPTQTCRRAACFSTQAEVKERASPWRMIS